MKLIRFSITALFIIILNLYSGAVFSQEKKLSNFKLDKNIKAIIFDCDGVLVDSEYLKFLAWNKALKNYNIELKMSDYLQLVGNSSEYILNWIKKEKNLILDEKDYDFIKKKDILYRETQSKYITPFFNAIAFAKWLYENKNKFDIKIGLASSAPKEEILNNLKKTGLSNIFDSVISGSDDLQDIKDPEGTNKPKPYIYQRIASWLNIKPENCIVFEDTEAGVNAAHAAGMKVFAIPNKFSKNQDFSKAVKIIYTWEKMEKNLELLEYAALER